MSNFFFFQMRLKFSQVFDLAMPLDLSSWTSWAALDQKVPCCSVTRLLQGQWISVPVTTLRMLGSVALVRKVNLALQLNYCQLTDKADRVILHYTVSAHHISTTNPMFAQIFFLSFFMKTILKYFIVSFNVGGLNYILSPTSATFKTWAPNMYSTYIVQLAED